MMCQFVVNSFSAYQSIMKGLMVSFMFQVFYGLKKSISYLQQLMIALLNKFRQNPKIFQKQLQERLNCINQNNLLFSPKHPYKSIKTKEGTVPIKEILDEININRQLIQLNQNVFLNECASYIADSYRDNKIDEPTFMQDISKEIRSRIASNGKYQFEKEIKCIIGVGFKEEGEPLLSILINDGDAARQRRKILLKNAYEYCGYGCSRLNDASLVCGVYLLANLNKQIS